MGSVVLERSPFHGDGEERGRGGWIFSGTIQCEMFLFLNKITSKMAVCLFCWSASVLRLVLLICKK